MTSLSNPAPTPEQQAARKQAGEMLRAAREAAGRSAGELATQLKVSGDKIDAVESGAWERLPDPAFARGLLRAAAKAVKADADAILKTLVPTHAVSTTGGLAGEPVSRPKPAPGRSAAHASRKLWWWAVLVIVLAALGIFFLPHADEMHRWLLAFHDSGQLATKPTGNGQPQVAASAPHRSAGVTEAATGAAPAAVSSAAAGAAPAAAPQAPASAALPAAATSGPSLSLQATAESWVQVRSQQGKVLFAGIVPANGAQVVTVSAQDLPVKLIVGNAGHTQVMFNGQSVNLAPGTMGNVARLMVPASAPAP